MPPIPFRARVAPRRPRPDARRRRPLRIEGLESRVVPATLTQSGAALTYTAGAGIGNSLSVGISGSNFVFTETGETVTTSIAGASGSGTGNVSVPTTGLTSVILNLGDGTDTIAAG